MRLRGGEQQEPFQVGKWLEQKLGIRDEGVQGMVGVALEATEVPLRWD